MNAMSEHHIELLQENLIASNAFGTYFGISQERFNEVWDHLTDPTGNSVAYISMEIGADPDVYSPIRDALRATPIHGVPDSRVQQFVDKFFQGPQKIPNYSGGLGILAGDTLKSYADCHFPVVAVSLLYRKGYFSQYVDSADSDRSHRKSTGSRRTPRVSISCRTLIIPDNPCRSRSPSSTNMIRKSSPPPRYG